MTRNAGHRRFLVTLAGMASDALNFCVRAGQGKFCLGVIKGGTAPGF